MVSAKGHGFGVEAFDFLHHSGVIHRSGGDSLNEHHFGLARFFDKGLGIIGQALAIVALVVDYGNLFCLEGVEDKIDDVAGLDGIAADGTKEVGVIAALGQFRGGG